MEWNLEIEHGSLADTELVLGRIASVSLYASVLRYFVRGIKARQQSRGHLVLTVKRRHVALVIKLADHELETT